MYKCSNVYLILVQKFSNFFLGFYKVVEISSSFFKNYPSNNFFYLYSLLYMETTEA